MYLKNAAFEWRLNILFKKIFPVTCDRKAVLVQSQTNVLLCAETCCTALMNMAKEARKSRLGPLHPAYNLLQNVQDSLLGNLPEDAHVRVSGKLCVSLTRVSDGRNVLVSEFDSREELVQVCRTGRELSGLYLYH